MTTHVPVPEQPPPDQPVKDETPPGVAVNVTLVPLLYASEQSPPQLMPAGLLVTVPLPDFVTVSVNCWSVNAAVTDIAEVTETTHVPVPEQPPPDQPVKIEFTLGEAVSVTVVPKLYASEQSAPQFIPKGLLVTVPEPEPDFKAVNVNC